MRSWTSKVNVLNSRCLLNNKTVSLQSCQLSTEVPMGKPLGQLVELGGEKGAVGTGAQVLAAWGAGWPL